MTALDKPRLLECPISTVVGISPEDLDNRLEAALATLDPVAVRVVRIGNLPRLQLTLKRLLLQISILDESSDSDEAAIANILGSRWKGESQIMLVIEQAETLEPDAMQFLQVLTQSFKQRTPSLHVLLAGSLALLDLGFDSDARLPGASDMDDAPAKLDRSQLLIPVPPPSGPLPANPALPLWRPLRLGLFAVAGLAFCLTVGAAVLVHPPLATGVGQVRSSAARDSQAAPAMLQAPMLPTDGRPVRPTSLPDAVPAPDATLSEPPQATTPEQAANSVAPAPGLDFAPSQEDTVRLRAAFNRFLARSGRSRTALTSAQRDALFYDYLQWRAHQAGDPVR